MRQPSNDQKHVKRERPRKVLGVEEHLIPREYRGEGERPNNQLVRDASGGARR